MFRITRIELYKIFKRPRSYIGFLAVLIFVAFTQLAVFLEGKETIEFLTQNLEDIFVLQGNLVNGYLVTFLILYFLWVHVPLLIVLVTGDLLSGEAQNGTFRLLLPRPVSRVRLVNAKFISALIYSGALVLFMGLLSLPAGLMIFGKGDMMVFIGTLNIIPEGELLGRFLFAFGFATISMATVASLSMMLSAMSNNSLGPILTTIAIIILLNLVSSINLGIFNLIRPFLFISYINSWQFVFAFEPDKILLMKHLMILIGHILIFYGVTQLYFARKDILS